MSRRLTAAIAVRNNSTRLYAKPLQRLDAQTTILEQLVVSLRSFPFVGEIVLAIAEGAANAEYVEVAQSLGCRHLIGSEADVLSRIVACARLVDATDILRKTSEDPYFDGDGLKLAWERHLAAGNDVTALDDAPAGAAFELLSRAALERLDASASGPDREHVTDFARFNQRLFSIEVVRPADSCRRRDLRITVDTPEDLIVARAIYRELGQEGKPPALQRIVEFLDARPDLRGLVAPYVDEAPVWLDVPQRSAEAAR